MQRDSSDYYIWQLFPRYGFIKMGIFHMPCEDHLITNDPHLVFSVLSSRMALDGMSVDVQIYRLDFSPIWALEVITDGGASLVWEELFSTDSEAFATFQMAAKRGLSYFLTHAECATLH